MYDVLRTTASFYSSTQLNVDWRPPLFSEDHPTVSLEEAEEHRLEHHAPWLAEATMFVNVMRRRVNSIKALLQSYHDMTSRRIECNRAYAESLIDASNTVDVETFPTLVAQHKHFGALLTDANRQEAVSLRDVCGKMDHLLAHDVLFLEFQPHVVVFGDEVIAKAELQLSTAEKLHSELKAIYNRRPCIPYEQNSYRWEVTYRQYWNAYVSSLALGDMADAQHKVEVFECKGWAHMTSFIAALARLLTQPDPSPGLYPQSPSSDRDQPEDIDCLAPSPWKTLLEKLRMMDPMSTQLSVVSTASSPTNPPLPVTEFPIIAGAPPILLKSTVWRLVKSPFQSTTEWQPGMLVLTLAREILCFDADGQVDPVAAAMLGNSHIRIDLSSLTLSVDENPNSAWWSKSVSAALSSLSTGLPGLTLPANNFVVKIASPEEFEQWRGMVADFQAQARLDIGHSAQGRMTYSDSAPSRPAPARRRPSTDQYGSEGNETPAEREEYPLRPGQRSMSSETVRIHDTDEIVAEARRPSEISDGYISVAEPWYDLNLEDDGSYSADMTAEPPRESGHVTAEPIREGMLADKGTPTEEPRPDIQITAGFPLAEEPRERAPGLYFRTDIETVTREEGPLATCEEGPLACEEGPLAGEPASQAEPGLYPCDTDSEPAPLSPIAEHSTAGRDDITECPFSLNDRGDDFHARHAAMDDQGNCYVPVALRDNDSESQDLRSGGDVYGDHLAAGTVEAFDPELME